MALADLLKVVNAFTVKDYLTSRNGLLVPTGNLGISRSQMPQIKHFDRFKSILNGYGVSVGKKRRRVGDIKMIQNEINKDKVFKLMMDYRKNNKRTRGGVDFPGNPPVLSSDGYVLDGTHRFVAMYNINKNAYHDFTVVDMPAKELYELVRNDNKFFNVVEYKSVIESEKGA